MRNCCFKDTVASLVSKYGEVPKGWEQEVEKLDLQKELAAARAGVL